MSWPSALIDKGPLLDLEGSVIGGADPCLVLDPNGQWAELWCTNGPNLPPKPGDHGSPGIFRRTFMGKDISDLSGPWGPRFPVFIPDGRPDRVGFETVSLDYVPGHGWVGLVSAYRSFRIGCRMIRFTWEGPGSEAKLDESVQIKPDPTQSWEQWGTLGDHMGEPGVCWTGYCLLSCYSALSDMPKIGRAWRLGMLVSLDGFASYSRHALNPVLIPKAVFEEPSGINMESHGCLLAGEDASLELFVHESGKVAPEQKGIGHYAFRGSELARNPAGILLSSEGYGHVGGPSIKWIDGKRAGIIHATEKENPQRFHLRWVLEG